MKPDVWVAFQRTTLVIAIEPPLEVGVAGPLEVATRTARFRLHPSGTFAVITPCNPNGAHVSPANNARRLAEFRAELKAREVRSVKADGWSPDRIHVERGNACALSLPAAIALARRWQQLALFWFDGQRILLVPVPLANTSERPGHIPDHQPSSDA
jgi:hypothetical protein